MIKDEIVGGSSIEAWGQAIPVWKIHSKRLMAAEISRMVAYYDELIQYKPMTGDHGDLLNVVNCPSKSVVSDLNSLADFSSDKSRRVAILFNGNFNNHYDIQNILMDLKPKLSRTSRVIVVAYNPYLSWLYKLASFLGLKEGATPTTFITHTDLRNIASLSGFEVVKLRPVVFVPWKFFGLGTCLNAVLSVVPWLRRLGLASILTLRPVIAEASKPSLSVVIPARNEKGNIENALKRMPDLAENLEIIFVEGHSNDGTWEEIQRVIPLYENKFKILALRQQGKGKSDAVRLGFSKASGELLTILDADLTMPPELLSRFYNAYREGLADFINGTRLVYPMEGEAMRFLNLLGNVFFAKMLSLVLDSPIGDSLCGTKLMRRDDYGRMTAWRKDFGEFDPFGDFELLFPASILGLGIIDVPIRYRARTYGSTNISRFRHGLMLLKMTLIGFFRIKPN